MMGGVVKDRQAFGIIDRERTIMVHMWELNYELKDDCG